MTLKTRFALMSIGNTAAVVAIFVGTYYFLENRSSAALQREEQVKTARTAATQCGAMQLSENPIAALDYINAIKRDPAVLSITCFDAKGRIQVHSDAKLIGHAVSDLPSPSATEAFSRLGTREDGLPVIIWRAPARAGSDVAAWAEIVMNERLLKEIAFERLWRTLERLAWVALVTFFLSLALGLAIAWSLSAPISGLVAAVREIAGGNLKYQTDLMLRDDELGFLAKEINVMAAKLAQLDELKDEFISSVSHDLRSPVAAIGMYVEWMLEGDADKDKVLPKHRNWLITLRENAVRLTTFVTNVLDAAKMKAGRMEYHLKPVPVAELVEKLKKLFDVMAANYGIAIELEMPPDLPQIRADAERLDQVITNLISNAIKFTRRGGKIRLGAVKSDGWIEIYVADNGRGISKEDLGRMFQKFNQFGVAGSNPGGVKGTGIGLSISREAIEAMGGTIRVESELGKGTRFSIRMPVSPEAAHEA